MKVAVVTFPLINNYGGIIQAYALVKALVDLGHEANLVNLQSESYSKTFLKFLIKKYGLFFIKKYRNSNLTRKDPKLSKFVNSEINPKTKKIHNSNELRKLFSKTNFDACIVGSDQVFSTLGYSCFENDYSLSCAGDDVIKLSYAASFGGGEFLGDKRMIPFHSEKLKKFREVSVREASAIKVCKDIFQVNATHVLDPTMIINKDYFLGIINSEKHEGLNGSLFAYVLDDSLEKAALVSTIAERKALSVNKINDGNLSSQTLSMSAWLNNIYSSDHVITDSFHGCVFCIIFNKPFNCIINKKRGADRFYSLLEMFGLEARILNDNYIEYDIDWEIVNSKLAVLKEESLAFIQRNLR